ncbi:hypothetical protein LCGC14_0694380 [marine sediment metagenome]|uniref:Uncharacterized protein n=1 Tax=marine sediment metagenome TaxID=412755 RepID=A0A0F9T5X1_9ZZZZ
MNEEEDEDEISINPDKVDEVIEDVYNLLYKKKKTKNEEARLWILCMVAFEMKSREIKKLYKYVSNRIANKNIKTEEQLEKDVNAILDRTIIITKSLR